VVCRSSSKDATLLFACVMEAQSTGDNMQAIAALERVLDKYDHSAPAGVHLPALLRWDVKPRAALPLLTIIDALFAPFSQNSSEMENSILSL
jgi:hypothetical protein